MSNQNVRPDVSQLNTSEYTHKQKTHIVNGVEIPDLRVVPEHGDSYYLVDPTVPELSTLYKFTGTVIDMIWVERGLAYQPTEEGKRAAILHAKAMLGVATGATAQGVAAQAEQYPPCDFCGDIPDHHPWHGSGMFKGVDSPHIHACNGCRHLLPSRTEQPAQDVSALVEALEEARLTLEVMQGRGSSVGLTLAIIDRALATHRKLGGLR